MPSPSCRRCGKRLERIEMSRGAKVIGGTLPALYEGVICQQCKSLECSGCKIARGALQAPCAWCGGAVSPAFEHLLGSIRPAPPAAMPPPRVAAEVPVAEKPKPTRPQPPAHKFLSASSIAFAVVFLGAIVFVTFPEIKKRSQMPRYDRTRMEMRTIMSQFQDVVSEAPPEKASELRSISDFSALFQAISQKGGDGRLERDDWGQPYLFIRQGDVYALVSRGPDGILNSPDPLAVPVGLAGKQDDDIVLFHDSTMRGPTWFSR